ncbi:MAG: hypothetical protein ACE5JI_01120 [Acidobacteriota bacterium]
MLKPAGVLLSVLLLGLAGYLIYLEVQGEPACQVCYRPLHKETFYQVLLEGGKSSEVCCPRCGLRFQAGREDVVSSKVADFNTGERFDARKAFYVENSSVNLCARDHRVKEDRSGAQYQRTWDRCSPSLIAFKTHEDAEAFWRDNGGVIMTYPELLEEEP